MFIPILTLDYISQFPWYLGPCLQILGFFCLLATRYTTFLYPRIGKSYYLGSSILRLLGIFLITWAWLEILANEPDFFSKLTLRRYQFHFLVLELIIIAALSLYDSFLRRFLASIFLLHFLLSSVFNLTYLLSLLIHHRSHFIYYLIHYISNFSFIFRSSIVLYFRADYPFNSFAILFMAFIWSIWSILELGLRRSLLYIRINDPLIYNGPYLYQRHPQLFSALIMIIMSIFSLIPSHHDDLIGVFPYRLFNLFIAIAAIFIIIHYEEKDLQTRLETQYKEYKQRVPCMVTIHIRKPNLSWYYVINLTLWGYILSLLVFIVLFREVK